MGKKGLRLRRSLQVYLSKLKRVPASLHFPSSSSSSSPRPPAATSWLISACKYPRTPSFAFDRDRGAGAVADVGACHVDDTHAATLSDVDRFLHENFHTLYSRGGDDDDEDVDGGFSDDSPGYNSDPPGAEEIRSTGRFFASPGTSNSLLEDTRPSDQESSSSLPSSSSSTPLCNSVFGPKMAGGDGVALMTFSKDPYEDFRRSMQDMVESRQVDPGQPLDWDFMEELLFCYLELNDRSVHKYILRAFTDLVVSCRRRIPASSRRRNTPATSGVDKASRRRSSTPEGGREGDAAGAPRHLPATDRRRGAQRLVGSR